MPAYKNELDPPPVVQVDLYVNARPGTPLPAGRYYRVEWTTNQALFLSPSFRNESNFYPVSPLSGFSYQRTFTSAMLPSVWAQFKKARTLYYRVGSGTTNDQTGWAWSAPKDYQVNHMPNADAGPARRIQLASGTSVAASVVLDGGGSSDPDAGSTLTYQWELETIPADWLFEVAPYLFLQGLQTRLAAAAAQLTALPAGAPVPAACKGTSTFKLTVQDSDPPSILYATRGRDSARVEVTLGGCDSGICVDFPTSVKLARVERTGPIAIEVGWSVAASVRSQLIASAAGFAVELSVRHLDLPPSGPPDHRELEFTSAESGMFVWDGNRSDGSPAPGGLYAVAVRLKSAFGQPLSLSGVATMAEQRPAIEIEGLAAWAPLLSFRAPTPIQTAINARGALWFFHRIEDGWGGVNLDYYPVRVTALPTVAGQPLSAQALLDHIRRHLDAFVDQQIGDPEPYDAAETTKWMSAVPLGTVVHWDMNEFLGASVPSGLDDGSVVCTETTPQHWVFSTINAPGDFAHPVSGNREFGYVPNLDGSFTFFTRGTDRPTRDLDWLLQALIWKAADLLWLSLQQRIAAFVNANGGSAQVLPRIATREDWSLLRARYSRPTIPWEPHP